LWVASEAIPQMNGAREGDPPRSALFEFDVDTGKLRREHAPPASPNPPYFDDLAVAADGRVYVNDGRTPRIYALDPGKDLAVFLETDAMRGTQGLAATPDGKTLYASDYGGLYGIDVATKAVAPIPVPPDLALNGIDGLVYTNGRLVAIQNGIEPHRILLLELSPGGATIARGRILEMNNPHFDEPTLGTVVGDALYVSANNQGHRYYDLKNPPGPGDLQDAVILKVPLHAEAR
jgi:outer membrane protein assembly factor BamB